MAMDKKDWILEASTRDMQRRNTTGGWYSEFFSPHEIDETPKTYVVEFEGKKFVLEKLHRINKSHVMTNWQRDDDNYHFNMVSTARTMWNKISSMLWESRQQVEAAEKKWLAKHDEVDALKDEIRLLKEEKGSEWNVIPKFGDEPE